MCKPNILSLMTSVQILKLLLVSLLLVLANCSPFRAKEDPTRYYVLTAKSQGILSSGPKLAVGVGPVTIPGYLERDEIHRLIEAVDSKWAPYLRPVLIK